jgi:bifunctional DNA-binding transcriptional regulator/antitoxin component of YhaV-PrlF toxin-antitoxin module
MDTRDQQQPGAEPGPQATAPAQRPHRLRIDARGRVLLPPPLRAATGLLPNQPLTVVLADEELHVSPAGEDRPAGNLRLPTLDRKGRLTLPGPLRTALGLAPGGTVLMQPLPPGMRLVTPARLLGRLREARESLTRHLERG